MFSNRWLKIIFIALAYVITARLGLLLALTPGFATAFWPPSGIAVASLLLYGYPVWPGIFLGSLVANLLTPVSSISSSIIVSTGIAIGSTLQPLAIVYLLKNLTNSIPHLFQTRRNIISLLLFTLLCCTISSTLSLTSLYLAGIVSGSSLGTNWVTWWLGDTIGIYLFAPFIFAWSKPCSMKSFLRHGGEAFWLFAITLAISFLCFGGWLSKGFPLEYLLLPCLVWSVFRFGQHVTTILLLLISVIALLGTTHGYGPFVQSNLNESLLLLQAFLGVVTGTTLILISVVNEVWHAQEVLEEYSQDLKNQVKHRSVELQEKLNQLEEQNRQLIKALDEKK
jgi:integral membrane sensor domain MASE1